MKKQSKVLDCDVEQAPPAKGRTPRRCPCLLLLLVAVPAMLYAQSSRITFEPLYLQIRIQDNGEGFVPGQRVNAGNGLSNMKKRMADIDAKFEITSGTGGGTDVFLAVKL